MAKLGNWEYTCDRASTIEAYSQIAAGGAETCTCNMCRNFVAARERIFPANFFSFLESLGIDARKDGEVYHNARIEPGRHDYAGWFHFIGTLDRDGDFPKVELAHGFVAWLCRASAPPLASLKGRRLVQLEFHSKCAPWVLNEPEAQ